MVSVSRLAPPVLLAALLASAGSGVVLLLLPIDGLRIAGLVGGFGLPGMLAVGGALTPVPGAMLVARLGHKRVMCGGLALSALAIAALSAGGTPAMRGIAALFHGIGLGLNQLSRVTYLSDAVRPEHRGRLVSAVGGLGRVGMFIGPAAGGYLASHATRAAALLAASGALALAGILLAFLPACATVPARERHRNPLRLFSRVIAEHRRTFATVGIAMLGLALVRNGRMLLIPICGTLIGLDESRVGFVKSLSMGADMLFFYPAGVLMDRFGRKWSAVPCMLLLALGVFWLGHAESYGALLWAAVIAGVGNGLGSGINMTLAGDFSPRAGRADFLGVWSLLTETGAASAPFVMGAVAAALALGHASTVVAVVGALSALLVASTVPEPLSRRRLAERPLRDDHPPPAP